MNIGATGAIGATSSIIATGTTGSICSIGVAGANTYIIGAHSECHQQPPSVGCGR